METLYLLLIVLLITRVCGEVAIRFKQPALAGELIGGIILGVIAHYFHEALPMLSNIHESEIFLAFKDLGVFFLMLLAGLKLSPKDLAKSSIGAFFVAIGGLVVPLCAGLALALFVLPDSSAKSIQALFLGTALAITAIPVATRVLLDIGQLRTRLGSTIISAAVVDDVLGLVLLAILTALLQTGQALGLYTILTITIKVAAFFIVCPLIGHFLFPLIGKLVRKLSSEEFEFSSLLILGLIFAIIAEKLGLHFIIGAFFAGLYFTKKSSGKDIIKDVSKKVNAITAGFLAPLFFAFIGLNLQIKAFIEVPLFVLTLIAFALISKLVGAGLVARLFGFPARHAMGIGFAMSARGAVELIIADIALESGLFERGIVTPIVENMFSSVVIMAIATTLLMPVCLKFILPKKA